MTTKGYRFNRQTVNKDSYYSILKMKNKSIEKNFILDCINMRNKDGANYSKLNHIIQKNDILNEEISTNEIKLKKILCEKKYRLRNDF